MRVRSPLSRASMQQRFCSVGHSDQDVTLTVHSLALPSRLPAEKIFNNRNLDFRSLALGEAIARFDERNPITLGWLLVWKRRFAQVFQERDDHER